MGQGIATGGTPIPHLLIIAADPKRTQLSQLGEQGVLGELAHRNRLRLKEDDCHHSRDTFTVPQILD